MWIVYSGGVGVSERVSIVPGLAPDDDEMSSYPHLKRDEAGLQ